MGGLLGPNTHMNGNHFRWGILGTAQIARKNWRAIRDSGNPIVAVASRHLERSRRFIAECQAEVPFETIPEAYGSYESLLASPAVDAVYIPLPTGLRKEWVLRAAAAGKHIVSEKPCAVSVADLREMLEACRRHRVQFMDGVMFMHSPRLAKIREILDDGQNVGEVRRISSAFSFYVGGNFFRDLQLPRATRIFHVQHTREQRTGTSRLPGRPRVVLHPVCALGDGLANAATGDRSDTESISGPRKSGSRADGVFRRTPVFRRRLCRVLLFLPDRDRTMGERQWLTGSP